MELGGNAPFVVFEDADVDAAVGGAMLAKFRNIGQACTAANRFIVHESVADEFAHKLSERVAALRVGDGRDPDTDIGPLINDSAVTKVSSLVQDATDRGSLTLAGAQAPKSAGSYYPPTVLHRVPAGSHILREEVFGPVVAISTFTDEGEAVTLANDTEYGLVAYVYTESLSRVHRMIEQIETGMMAVNSGIVSNAAAPFGGVKHSGLGREGGAEGIHEYLETKYTLIPR
jgi:succinate-semialdehyde dehydrogenase/glutarate-semialdehyde dehydrogenase